MLRLAIFAVGSTISTFALAEPTKDQCIAANEGGQDLQRDGHLRAAVERFASCAVAVCPAPVRADCARRRDEAQRATPLVDLTVTNPEGGSVAGLELRIDGAVFDLAPGLQLEPGAHVVELRARGYVSVTRQLVLHANEHVHEDIVMRHEAPGASSAGDSTRLHNGTRGEGSGGSRRTLAYVLGGVGVVAIGIGAATGVIALNAASERDDACGADFPACVDANRRGELKHRQDQIATAGNISTVAFIGGGVLVAASVWLYLSTGHPARAGLQPWQRALAQGQLRW